MSTWVHDFFNYELTSIPGSIRRLLGDNFNNTLCNGVTWLVLILHILHSCYDKLFDIYLKQQGFQQYIRQRLKDSLWFLAFYTLFFTYFLMTINSYNLPPMFQFRRNMLRSQSPISDVSNHQLYIQALFYSFFIYTGCQQGLKLKSLHAFSKFILLTVACGFAHILRISELPLILSASVALSGLFDELSRLFYTLWNWESKSSFIVKNGLFISTLLIFCLVHLILVPFFYLIPLGVSLLSRYDATLLILFVSLLGWMNLALYRSPLLNCIFHLTYHTRGNKQEEISKETDERIFQLECLGNTLECSLFPPRTDEGFVMALLRSEAKKRQNRMIAKRKPKNRNMIIQTLKCMMAIKRKLNEKRSDSSDETDSEESDENTDKDFLLQKAPEEEEESDDESSEESGYVDIKKSDKVLDFGADQAERKPEAEERESEVEIKSINLENQQTPSQECLVKEKCSD